jgi:predicted metal-dependent hydrolase
MIYYFNYKIIYLRPDLADYLITHELCHLGELNHSKRFWTLVSKTIPDYIKASKELKKIHIRRI